MSSSTRDIRSFFNKKSKPSKKIEKKIQREEKFENLKIESNVQNQSSTKLKRVVPQNTEKQESNKKRRLKRLVVDSDSEEEAFTVNDNNEKKDENSVKNTDMDVEQDESIPESKEKSNTLETNEIDEVSADEHKNTKSETNDKDMDEEYTESEKQKTSPKKSKKDKSTTVTSLAKTSKLSADNIPSKYDPIEKASWKKGTPVPYSALAAAFDAIEATTKRIQIQEILTQLFRSVIAQTPEDLLACVYLSCNKIAPAFKGVEIGVGDSFIIKVMVNTTGRSKAKIQDDYEEIGDLGEIASKSKSKQKTLFGFKAAPLSVREVLEGYRAIANESGNKSQDKKIGKIQKMFVRAHQNELKYLVRGLQGKLRIGLAEQSVLVSLAHALVLTPPSKEYPPPLLDAVKTLKSAELLSQLESATETIKRAYSELPTYDELIPAVLEGGLEKVEEVCHIRAGIPLKPMLAKPTKGISEVLDRFQGVKFTCEYKYDGERAQIHLLEDGTINVYSRNSEDNTAKYPDVVGVLPDAFSKNVTSCIIDSEVVAYDVATEKLLPFQILSTRARKNVKKEDIKVQVIICAFDLLFLNGKSYLRESFETRRKALHEHFSEVKGKFVFAQGFDGTEMDDIQTFLTDAVDHSCEGLMVKTLEVDATYEPSRRSLNWLKLKKDYMDGVTDSLDLVPIGAFYGKGKRTGSYGAYLLASYDEDEGEYQSICKIGTGFSDVQLVEHHNFFKEKVLTTKPRNVVSDMTCDVWFDPCQVWEVLAADLSISPIHKAARGKVDSNKGIALRFPRFIRIREDKSVEQATNGDQVAEMYLNQNLATQSGKMANDDY